MSEDPWYIKYSGMTFPAFWDDEGSLNTQQLTRAQCVRLSQETVWSLTDELAEVTSTISKTCHYSDNLIQWETPHALVATYWEDHMRLHAVSLCRKPRAQ